MEGYEFSPNGEVVLSVELKKKFERFIGKDVIINTVESFRIDYDYQKVIKTIFDHVGICSESRRRKK